MRLALLLFSSLTLCACTAVVTRQLEAVDTIEKLATITPPPPPVEIGGSGSTFLAKFATNAALNSGRSFVSDYHGEVRITLYPNRKMECRFWTEGRVTDPTLYDGINGFVEAFSSLCVGKLQRNGSFEFRGAYISEGPHEEEQEDVSDDTFTLQGNAKDETITGELIIGGVFSQSAALGEAEDVSDLGKGIRFQAIKVD